MGWKSVTVMSQRIEFVKMVLEQRTNMSELCHRFGISRKTGYKYLNRYNAEGIDGLADRSKRPQFCPHATDPKTERLILRLRDQHPAWGGRKLKRRLEDLEHTHLPSASTITAILKRNGRITPEESAKHKPWRRFESGQPNDLWQMDFKGHFPVQQGRCHPLTVLDDHSRYALCVAACSDEGKQTVAKYLVPVFQRYGLPETILVDHGAPWGHDRESRYTAFSVWLLRLGIRVAFSRPSHPQTLGKDERFHRTLKAEVIPSCINRSISSCQRRFDRWRLVYNTQRPHEALNMSVPIKHYQISQRPFPVKLPHIEYGPDDIVRKVQDGGKVHFRSIVYRVSNAFKGQPVAIRPTDQDGKFDVYYVKHVIGHIDLT